MERSLGIEQQISVQDRLNLLNNIDRSKPYRDVPARPAATLILFDDSDHSLKLYMGKRHPQSGLAKDLYAFPGGAVETEDSHGASKLVLPHIAPLIAKGDRIAKNQQTPPTGLLQLLTCAYRETYEETGIAINHPSHENENKSQTHGKLFYIGRAITPPGRKYRFDTHFLALNKSHTEKTATPKSRELEDQQWVPIAEVASLALHPMTNVFINEFISHLEAIKDQSEELCIPLYAWEDGKFIRHKLFSSKMS